MFVKQYIVVVERWVSGSGKAGLKYTLVAQIVKHVSAMWRPGFDPWVGKIPLEKEMTAHSSNLAWKNPMDGGAQ